MDTNNCIDNPASTYMGGIDVTSPPDRLEFGIPFPRHPDGKNPSPAATFKLINLFSELRQALSFRDKNKYENRQALIQTIGLAIARTPIQTAQIDKELRDSSTDREARNLLYQLFFADQQPARIGWVKAEYHIPPNPLTEWVYNQWLIPTQHSGLHLLVTDYLESTSAGLLVRAAKDIAGRSASGLNNPPDESSSQPLETRGLNRKMVSCHLVKIVEDESIFQTQPQTALHQTTFDQFKTGLERGRSIPIFPLDQINQIGK